MKIIITEEQQQKSLQKIIDFALSNLNEKCDEQEEMGADAREIVSFDACEALESTTSVKVVHSKYYNGSLFLFLDFYFESITYVSADDLIWELQYQAQSLMGKGNIKLVHNDTINNKIDPNW
jgi:hypothetical protein